MSRDERSPAPALSRFALLEDAAEPEDESVTIESVLSAAEFLRAHGAEGALLAIMGADRAIELGLEDGQCLARGRRTLWARIDHEAPPGMIMVASMFPDPRQAVRKHASAEAERG